MKKKMINFVIDEKDVNRLDNVVDKDKDENRSSFIRLAIKKEIERRET